MRRTYETEKGFLKARAYYDKTYSNRLIGSYTFRTDCFVIDGNWEKMP